MRLKNIVILFLLTCLAAITAYGQGFYTDFGQNRVQYHPFEWSYYESENFSTYFYQGGHELGKFAVLTAEGTLDEIESKLEYKVNNKIEIMVYHNLSDQRQSNIGIGFDPSNTGGTTKIIGNKIFVYFDGNHYNLEKQIKQGVAKVLLDNMVYGGNIQEVLQNAVLLNLPDWFINGLISYAGEDWSTEKDDRLREGIAKGKYRNFSKLDDEEAAFAGHALWHYISQLHGEAAIPNLLYLTRINRSLESGFLFVLGNTLKATIEEFNQYYENIFATEKSGTQTLDEAQKIYQTTKRMKKNKVVVDHLSVSPDGRYVAYTTDHLGLHKVYLYDLETNSKKTLLKNGFRSYAQLPDYNYPLLAWDNQSRQLAMVYERRDGIEFMLYDVFEQKKIKEKPITKFEQVLGITFTDDPRKMVLSGVQSGQIDLYSYFIPNTKTARLTNDHFSDLQPRFIDVGDYKGILFRSNRLDNVLRTEKLDSILPNHHYDLYFYDLKRAGETLLRVTDTPMAEESFPVQYDSSHFAFLSNVNGINNIHGAYFDSIYLRTDTKVFFADSFALNPTYPLDTFQQAGLIDTIIKEDVYKHIAKTFPLSDFKSNILEQDIALKAGISVQLHQADGKYQFYTEPLAADPQSEVKTLHNTAYRNQLENLQRSSLNPPSFPKLEDAQSASSDLNNSDAKQETSTTLPKNEDLSLPMPDETQISDSIKNVATQPTDTSEIDIENYFFQSEFDFYDTEKGSKDPNKPEKTVAKTNKDTKINTAATSANLLKTEPKASAKTTFVRTKVRTYKVKFSIDHIVTQLDNTVIFNQYEPFDPNRQGFHSPDLNALIKVGVSDLLEDYKILGGFRMPLGLGGSEYFVEYQALKKRLDKKVLFYRKATTDSFLPDDIMLPEVNLKLINHYVQTSLIWPFDINRSIRGHFGYRSDKTVYQTTNEFSLNTPDQHENWAFTKLEYVFDNTLELQMNILNGTRYKIYAEFHKPFMASLNDTRIAFDIKDTGFLGIVGADFRHYQPLHKQIILATRFSAATSFGSRQMIYYLGAIENWMVFDQAKRFNSDTPIDETVNYGFQSLATNLRGFKQNIRNGSSYAVLNAEIRVPIFSYLANNPIRSDFLRNFQIVTFFDAGTAWEGLSPFSERNRYYSIEIGQPPVEATVNYYKNPVVFGYGAGLRTKLLGYFLKADVAWGRDSGARTNARWYVAMGLDF